MVEQKQNENKQGGRNIEGNKGEKHFNPAMYKQVEDIREPICCALGRIAGDRCVGVVGGAKRLCNLIAVPANSRLIKTEI